MYTSTIKTLKINLKEMETQVEKTVEKGKKIEETCAEKEKEMGNYKIDLDHQAELDKEGLDRKYREDAHKLISTHKGELTDIRKDFDKILKDLKQENEMVRNRLDELQDI